MTTTSATTVPRWELEEGFIDAVRKDQLYESTAEKMLNAPGRFVCNQLVSSYHRAVSRDFPDIMDKQQSAVKVIGEGELITLRLMNISTEAPAIFESDGTMHRLHERDAELRGLSLLTRQYSYSVHAVFGSKRPELLDHQGAQQQELQRKQREELGTNGDVPMTTAGNAAEDQLFLLPDNFRIMQNLYERAATQAQLTKQEREQYPFLTTYTINPRMPTSLMPACLGGPTTDAWSRFDPTNSCPFDTYGPFLINGVQRVFIGDWCQRHNTVFVSVKRAGEKQLHIRGELRSEHTGMHRSLSTVAMLLLPETKFERPQLMVLLPFVNSKVPLSHVMRLLGWRDDWTRAEGITVEERIVARVYHRLRTRFETNRFPLGSEDGKKRTYDDTLMSSLEKLRTVPKQPLNLRETMVLLRSMLPSREAVRQCQQQHEEEQLGFNACPQFNAGNINTTEEANVDACRCFAPESQFQACHKAGCRCYATRYFQTIGASVAIERKTGTTRRKQCPTHIACIKKQSRLKAGQQRVATTPEAAQLYIALRTEHPTQQREHLFPASSINLSALSDLANTDLELSTKKRSRIKFADSPERDDSTKKPKLESTSVSSEPQLRTVEGDIHTNVEDEPEVSSDGNPYARLSVEERAQYCPVFLDEQRLMYNARRTILKDICPHVAISGKARNLTEREINDMKADVLLDIVEHMLLVEAGRAPETNKDDSTKRAADDVRVVTSGFLRRAISKKYRAFQDHISKRYDARIILTQKALFADESWTRQTRRAFALGDFSEGAHASSANGGSKNAGAVQLLNRTNKMAIVTQASRVTTKINPRGKEYKARQVTNIDRLFDPFWTPDGPSCGLTKTRALDFLASEGSDDTYLISWLTQHGEGGGGVIAKNVLDDDGMEEYVTDMKNFLNQSTPDSITSIPKAPRVRVNGNIIGCHPNGKQLEKTVRLLRRHRLIDPQTMCRYYPEQNEVDIQTSANRPCSVLFICKNLLAYNMIHGEKVIRSMSYEDMKRNNLIEEIDCAEETTIATDLDHYRKLVAQGVDDVEHSILHSTLMLSFSGALNPYIEHTMPTRNTHQQIMNTQVTANANTNHRRMYDTANVAWKMMYPERALIENAVEAWTGVQTLTTTQCMRIAFATCCGFDLDDALVLDRGAAERGLTKVFAYNTCVEEERSQDGIGLNGINSNGFSSTGRVNSLASNLKSQHFRYFGPYEEEARKGHRTLTAADQIRANKGVKMVNGDRFCNAQELPCDGMWDASYSKVASNGLPFAGVNIPKSGHAIFTKAVRQEKTITEQMIQAQRLLDDDDNEDEKDDTRSMDVNLDNGTAHSHRGNTHVSRSKMSSGKHSGFVDSVLVTTNALNQRTAKARMCTLYDAAPGNKSNSRHGQKGVYGALVPTFRMIYNALGLRPNLMINPMAFPSRMTISEVVEAMATHVSNALGARLHGTLMGKLYLQLLDISNRYKDTSSLWFEPYNLDDPDRELCPDHIEGKLEREAHKMKTFQYILKKQGYSAASSEPHWNGFSGERLGGGSTTGLGLVSVHQISQSVLNRMAETKLKARSTGPVDPLSRQGVDAMRFGEMERDAVIGHRASRVIDDRMCGAVDPTYVPTCRTCNMDAIANDKEGLYYCKGCGANNEDGNLSNFVDQYVPYSFVQFKRFIRQMGIKPMTMCGHVIGQYTTAR